MNISCLILAQNEVGVIGDSITSCKPLAPMEILVIDDGSSDDTASRAEFHGAKVIQHKKKDFAEARNFAKEKARGDWLLYIDADERLTPELIYEIKQKLSGSAIAYTLPRVNYYLGKKWPRTEKMLRLFRKSALIKWYGAVHESPEVTGEISELKGPLLHYTHRNLREMVENTIVWSEIEAKLRFSANHPPVTWWRIPRVMGTTFFDYYISQRGWQVGTVGLIESMYQAFSMFVTYARLWELQQAKNI